MKIMTKWLSDGNKWIYIVVAISFTTSVAGWINGSLPNAGPFFTATNLMIFAHMFVTAVLRDAVDISITTNKKLLETIASLTQELNKKPAE